MKSGGYHGKEEASSCGGGEDYKNLNEDYFFAFFLFSSRNEELMT